MLATLKQFFSPASFQQEAFLAYKSLVDKSRAPFLYLDCQIEDTFDGRFDAIILHVFLFMQRVENEPELLEFSRSVQEAFFSDMDRSMREMGASDTGIGKRIKKMAVAFFGRMQAYRHAGNDETALKEALKRNLYRGREVSDTTLAKLMDYLKATKITFAAVSSEALLAGKF